MFYMTANKRIAEELLDGKQQPLKDVVDMCNVDEAANANKTLLERGNVNSVTKKEYQSINATNFLC